MKVSRPQQRMNPVAKWGSPAAIDPTGVSVGVASWRGYTAEGVSPHSCMDPRAKSLMKLEPLDINLQYKYYVELKEQNL